MQIGTGLSLPVLGFLRRRTRRQELGDGRSGAVTHECFTRRCLRLVFLIAVNAFLDQLAITPDDDGGTSLSCDFASPLGRA